MANNVDQRLHKLEQEMNLVKQRCKLLEETNAQLTTMIRKESVRVMGMTMASIGENMLAASAAGQRYQVIAVDDEHPVNDQTFYGKREGDKWVYHTMHKNEMTPVKLESLVEPMRNAVLQFIMGLDKETVSIAFNVYTAK